MCSSYKLSRNYNYFVKEDRNLLQYIEFRAARTAATVVRNQMRPSVVPQNVPVDALVRSKRNVG